MLKLLINLVLNFVLLELMFIATSCSPDMYFLEFIESTVIIYSCTQISSNIARIYSNEQTLMTYRP